MPRITFVYVFHDRNGKYAGMVTADDPKLKEKMDYALKAGYTYVREKREF